MTYIYFINTKSIYIVGVNEHFDTDKNKLTPELHPALFLTVLKYAL